MMTIVGTFAFNFNVVMPLFVTRTMHGSSMMFTLVLSVVSVGSLVGALYTARSSDKGVGHVIRGATLFGISLLIFAAAPNLGFAFLVALAVGFSSILFMTASTSIVQIRTEPAMRGRVLALQAIVFLGTTPVGGPLLGWICEQFGARAGFAVGGIACFVAAAWGRLAIRRLDEGSERHALEHVALPAGG